MTREPTEKLPVIYRIDGRKIRSAGDFYREIGSAVNGPGGYFGCSDIPCDVTVEFRCR